MNLIIQIHTLQAIATSPNGENSAPLLNQNSSKLAATTPLPVDNTQSSKGATGISDHTMKEHSWIGSEIAATTPLPVDNTQSSKGATGISDHPMKDSSILGSETNPIYVNSNSNSPIKGLNVYIKSRLIFL